MYRGVVYFAHTAGFGQFTRCLYLGFITLVRVIVVVVVSTVIWVPVGAKIGLSPRLSRYAQPVVQVLASFPAILLFPFAIVIFLALHLSLDYGAIFLMALGSQWYILFNVIAEASAIPTELREMADQFRFPWMQRWRELILPGIFPYYVTGGITAAGGAWNASIVAEIVTYGKHHLLSACRRLHRPGHRGGRLRRGPRGHRRHELLCSGSKPAAMAPALPPGGNQVLALTSSSAWRRGIPATTPIGAAVEVRGSRAGLPRRLPAQSRRAPPRCSSPR